jgi:hypothetical protein
MGGAYHRATADDGRGRPPTFRTRPQPAHDSGRPAHRLATASHSSSSARVDGGRPSRLSGWHRLLARRRRVRGALLHGRLRRQLRVRRTSCRSAAPGGAASAAAAARTRQRSEQPWVEPHEQLCCAPPPTLAAQPVGALTHRQPRLLALRRHCRARGRSRHCARRSRRSARSPSQRGAAEWPGGASAHVGPAQARALPQLVVLGQPAATWCTARRGEETVDMRTPSNGMSACPHARCSRSELGLLLRVKIVYRGCHKVGTAVIKGLAFI